MQNDAKLLPCPFCGAEAWLNDYEAKFGDMTVQSRCPQCKFCGCNLGYFTTKAKAVSAWNRRTPHPAPVTAREAPPTCVACEDNPKHPNIPCAVCGAHTHQTSVSVAEAAKVLVAAWDADELPVSDPDPMLPEFIAALRALKGDSDD